MINPCVGDLLVAPPTMSDPRFRESVILLAHAAPDGHWGLCLNRSTNTTTLDLLPAICLDLDLDAEIYWGGPVSQGVIWMLHDPSWAMNNTLVINDQWSMTSHKEMFEELVYCGEPRTWRLFSGFSAWAPGQLEGEIAGTPPWTPQGSWLTCHSLDPAWAFAHDDHGLWTASISLTSQQAISDWMF